MLAAFTVPFTSFEVPIEIVVLGVVTGLLYALLGIGLVLTYKSSRVLNFAHGDMGALPAGLLLFAVVRYHVPYPIALLGALAAAVGIGGAVEFLVIRRLVGAPRLVVLVATIGAAQVLLGLNMLIPRDDFVQARYPVPFTASFRVGTLRLGTGEILILLAAPVVTAVVALFLRRSKIGLGARACQWPSGWWLRCSPRAQPCCSGRRGRSTRPWSPSARPSWCAPWRPP
jgi:branched-subunit amino acid ABC-type transport system permease component